MFGTLNYIDAIRFGNNAFLHVNNFNRCAISYILSAAFFKSAAYGIFAISYALVNSRRTGKQLAIQVLAELLYIVPTFFRIAIAHSIKHVNQVFKSRRRLGRISHGNLAL